MEEEETKVTSRDLAGRNQARPVKVTNHGYAAFVSWQRWGLSGF